MDKTFIIKIDPVSGSVQYENPDDLNFYEIMGALGIINLLMAKQFVEEE